MSFKEWYSWLRNLPWNLRWFPLLIIIRPVVDNLYFLKEVSPFLSPPYLVGVLTPVLAINAIARYRLQRFSGVDKAFSLWAFMICLACFMLLLFDPLSPLTLEFVLKISMPVYIYFFLRVFITDLRDLHGILQSFLYAGIFVAGLLIFEVVFNPIRIEESRGLQRIQASFGDVVSYGMYIVFAVISAAYFYFSRQHLVVQRKRMNLIIVVGLLALLGVLNIHHTATYTVFILLIALFVMYTLKTRSRGMGVIIILLGGIALSFWGGQLIEERLTPLVETDLAVYAGEQDTDRLFHGRVGRWRMMLEMFSSEKVLVQFFGFPLKLESVYQFIGIGSHNDFIRMLFATGIVGLLFYLGLLFQLFSRLSALGMAQRFLLTSTLLALLFYSISVTPTYYAPFMYFAMSVFAFVSLPNEKLQLWNGSAY